jgi:peptidoglycan L-alanyl-D-glutamate endopeptidase CwlK
MPLNAASEKKLIGVKPALVKVVRRAAEISKQPFQVVQGVRTLAQQRALYASGRTKPGPIVTWTLKSKHIGGNAIDFACLVGGRISWQEKHYPAVGRAMKLAAAELKTKIIWGGDWKRRDWGHVELA